MTHCLLCSHPLSFISTEICPDSSILKAKQNKKASWILHLYPGPSHSQWPPHLQPKSPKDTLCSLLPSPYFLVILRAISLWSTLINYAYKITSHLRWHEILWTSFSFVISLVYFPNSLPLFFFFFMHEAEYTLVALTTKDPYWYSDSSTLSYTSLLFALPGPFTLSFPPPPSLFQFLK